MTAIKISFWTVDPKKAPQNKHVVRLTRKGNTPMALERHFPHQTAIRLSIPVYPSIPTHPLL